MSEKLLTEAELRALSTWLENTMLVSPTITTPLERLIADHRRMREAIREQSHGECDFDQFCAWNDLDRETKDCTSDTCLWMECQP